jgi:hypothetical protein
MAIITIRNLDDQTQCRLLHSALADGPSQPADLATSIRMRFSRLGGVVLQVPARVPLRKQGKPGN